MLANDRSYCLKIILCLDIKENNKNLVGFFFSERGKNCEVVLITGVDMLEKWFF